MPIENKLRSSAGWAGIVTGLLGVFSIPLQPVGHPMQLLMALSLIAAALALWFESSGRPIRWRQASAALALGFAVGALGILASDGLLGLDGLFLRDHPVRGAQEVPRNLPHTALALIVAAVALLALRRSLQEVRRPLATLLACVVIAIACAALITRVLQTVASFSRPLQIPPLFALGLLALGVGTLMARPKDRLVRMLFSPSSAGALARRLFFGLTALPAALIGLIVLAIQFRLVDRSYATVLVVLALMLSGMLLAFLSVDSAVSIDVRREDSEQSRLLLTARLQEQAAQLQETVGVRTRELREANAHLREVADVNARLALVAHHATNGVVITDSTGQIEWVNAAFQHQSGFMLDEIMGKRTFQISHGSATDPEAIAKLIEAERSGSACNVELLNYTKDGRPYWKQVDLQPVRDSAGQVINFISIHNDVTEARLATKQLHQLNQRLALATQAAAIGVWEWDAHTRKSSWDERTLQIYGLPSSEFHGSAEDWKARLHPDDRTAAIEGVQSLVEGADEFDLTFRIIRFGDRVVRHVHSRAVTERDKERRLLRIIGTERDITDEREAVLQTEALNERLRLALRSSNFGVWELDLATGIRHWDDRMLDLYGVHRDHFRGANSVWLDALHPDDRARAEAYVNRVVSGELPSYDTEYRILRPDGSIRHVESHGYLQRDGQGHPIRLVGLNRDVTVEKNLQEALAIAEQRWQLALEGTNDGVWDWDKQTGVLYHDERWAAMLGYQSSEIPNTLEGWRRLMHPDDIGACEQAAQDHYDGRTPHYQHEHRMKTKTGHWKWILDRGKVMTRAADGKPLRMVGTHTDITARKELEERLRRTEAVNTQVSRLALIGGWQIDVLTAQLTWDDGTRRIHEVDGAFQPTLDNVVQFFHEEGVDLLRASRLEATPANPSYELEIPMVTLLQKKRWVRVIGQVEFRDTVPVFVHGAIQDVTMRHESEEARRELEGQLFQAQKMETLGTLAGGIAHDFNNLLTGIIGYHELAADSVPEDHPARSCLTEARNASLRARELVEQILTFGRHSAGAGHVPLDITLVVEEARRFLRATLPATIVIEHDISPYCPHVLGDATQIHQVLLNLGSNAAHAMRHHGGTLRIGVESTEVTPDLALSLGGPAAGSYVRFSVGDTGHGMDEATRRRIFDPFFTTKNTREGTGLGLAVVHGIVRAHRGVIDVVSSPGAGTTFHVYLPAATEERTRDDADLTGAPRGAGEFICIVDDEEIVGSCTKLVLESKGYRTVVYGSAEHCLQTLQNDPSGCALLLTDQTMPGMQGTDLVATMRRANPRLPVVIMSGYFSKIAPHVLDELGQVELLAKPFTTDELAHAVHRALHPERNPG